MSGEEYGRARGSAGSTGASARDFANQAQGLGGLVRLYATFAANIFAVTAAFQGLSRAMDTTNMIKGLDQLGAASGMALGTLSKRLVETTDGAVSLREAMTATAKATAAGLSSESVLRLGKVAQQASQALGVDAADALSRLSRGVTKLEPELLDELGIFTKVDQASREYARSIGKSAEQLTDFEKRMAFANAVLTEGERKFKAIDIDVNPYTKLSAALQNTLQSVLETVNKGIAPMVKLLAESPTGLLTALAAVSAVLIKQALPTIGEFKLGLKTAADQAQAVAKERGQAALQAQQKYSQEIQREVERRADAEIARVDAAEKRVLELKKSSIAKQTVAYQLLQKDIRDVDQADFQRLERSIERAKRAGKTKEAEAYREVGDSIRSAQREEENLKKTKEKLRQEVAEGTKGWSVYSMTQKAAQEAERKATASAIVSNAAYNGGLIGITKSIRLMTTELNNSEVAMNSLQKAAIITRGSFAAIGGAISTVVSRLGTVGMVAGAIIGIAELINGFFTKSAEATREFKTSIERLNESTANLGRTMSSIYATNPFSVTSLEAQGRAMLEVADSFDKFTNSAKAAQSAVTSSGWDKFWDRIFSFFGGGVQGNFEKALGTSILGAIDDLENSPIQTKVKENLQKLLEVKDVTNFKQLEKALEGLEPGSEKVKNIRKALRDAAIEAGNAASKSREFVDAQTKAKESFLDLARQFQVSDPVTKFASDNVTALLKLNTALEGPLRENLDALTGSIASLGDRPIFGIKVSAELFNLNEDVQLLGKNFTKTSQEIKKVESRIREITKLDVMAGFGPQGTIEQGPAASAERRRKDALKELEDIRSNLYQDLSIVETKLGKVSAQVIQGIQQGLVNNFSNIAAGMRAALQKGANEILQNLYAGIDTIPQLASRQFELKVEELNNDKEIIRQQAEIARSNYELKASLDLVTARQTLQQAKKDLEANKEDPQLLAAAEAAQKQVDIATKVRSFIQDAYKDPLGVLSRLQEEIKSGNPELAKYSQNIIAAAQVSTGLATQLKGIDRAIEQTDINKRQAIVSAIFAQQQQNIGLQKSELDINTQLLDQRQELGTISYEQYYQQKLSLIDKKAALDYDEAINQANRKYAQEELRAQNVLNESIKQGKEDQGKADSELILKQARQVYNSEQIVAFYRKGLATATAANAEANKLADYRKKELDYVISLGRAELAIAAARAESALTLQDIALQRAEQTESLPPEVLQARRTQLDLIREEQNATKQIQDASLSFAQQQINNQIEVNRLRDIGFNIQADRLQSQMQLDVEAHSQRISQIEAEKAARISSINAVQAYREQREDFSKQLEAVKNLDFVYEGIGTKLADLVTNIDKRALLEERNNKAIKQQQELVDTLYMTGQDAGKEEQKLNKLRQRAAKDELTADAATLNSTKKLFKEKTLAYKVLDKTEKAMHLVRLAMDAKELAVKIGSAIAGTTAKVGAEAAQTAATSAGFFARAGIYVSEIYAKTIGQLGVFGPPVAAALVAAIGLAAFGKRGTSGIFVPSAEQRQQTQGTAMGWDTQGNQVQVRSGVFGDTGAKSESIANSLEIISKNSDASLGYDNKLLLAFRKLSASIENVAKGAFRIQGLQGGSAFGTQTGTTTSGIASWLFGSKTSREIQDSGIQLRGTFLDLANAVQGTVRQFEIVSTTVTKGGFFGIGGGTSTTTATNYADLVGKELQTFSRVFDYGRDVLIATAEQAGQTASVVDQVLGKIRVDEMASLRGLTGEDFTKELSAVFSAVMDDAAEVIFGSFRRLQNFGEGLLETVTRVIDTNKKVEAQLQNLGFKGIENTLKEFGVRIGVLWEDTTKPFMSFDPTLIKNTTYDITDSLAELAGGLDNFLDITGSFASSFLTDEQRLANITRNVNQELERLGYTANITKDQYIGLVRAQDLTSERGRETFISLLSLADGMKEISDAADKAAEEATAAAEKAAEAAKQAAEDAAEVAKKIADETKQLNTQLYQAFGQTYLLRLQEIEALDQTNRVLKVLLYAVEDLAKAEANLQQAQQRVQGIQAEATNRVVSAQQKYLQAQKEVANFAIEAAKRMRDLGGSLREFVAEQSGVGTTGTRSVSLLRREFEASVTRALGGSEEDIAGLQNLASGLLESLKDSSSTYQQFESSRRQVLASLTKVADYTEQQASKVDQAFPETTKDPLTIAVESMATAKKEFEDAVSVALQISAPLEQATRDLVSEYKIAKADADKLQVQVEDIKSILREISTNTGLSGAVREGINKLTTATESSLSVDSPINTTLNTLNTTTELGLGSGSVIDKALGVLDATTAAGLGVEGIINKALATLDTTTKDSLSGTGAIASKLTSSDNTTAGDWLLKLSEATGTVGTNTENTSSNIETTNTITDAVGQVIADAGNTVAEATIAGTEGLAKIISEQNNSTLLAVAGNTSGTVSALETVSNNQVTQINYLASIATSMSNLATAAQASPGAAVSGSGNFLSNLFKGAGKVISTVVDIVFAPVRWAKKLLSDARVKQNISYVDTLSNGLNLYDFEYKAPYNALYGAGTKRGVLAQEVIEKYPNAVSKNRAGIMSVDYTKLGVPMNVFKFANGGVFDGATAFNMGIMGEAGPEAIMPLSRTSTGRLGVTADITPMNDFALQSNRELILELKNLRKEVEYLRAETRATVTNTGKTTRILERVTQAGDSITISVSEDSLPVDVTVVT
jgi:hypothetical protein